MSRPQGIIGMPSSRINCWIARPLAQLPVLEVFCGCTVTQLNERAHCFRSRIKDCFIFYGRVKREGNILFSPCWEAEEGHLHAYTGPVHVTYNWALDRTTLSKGLILTVAYAPNGTWNVRMPLLRQTLGFIKTNCQDSWWKPIGPHII